MGARRSNHMPFTLTRFVTFTRIRRTRARRTYKPTLAHLCRFGLNTFTCARFFFFSRARERVWSSTCGASCHCFRACDWRRSRRRSQTGLTRRRFPGCCAAAAAPEAHLDGTFGGGLGHWGPLAQVTGGTAGGRTHAAPCTAAVPLEAWQQGRSRGACALRPPARATGGTAGRRARPERGARQACH